MKKVRKIIWIPTVIVVAILVAVLVLSFVRVNPVLDNFGGYTRVNYLQSEEHEYREEIEGKIEEWLKTTDFSIMHAILEGQFSYGLKIKTLEGEEVTRNSAEIKAFASTEDSYVLKFCYDKANPKTIKVDNKEIYYDTMLLRVRESQGEVKEMECIPYIEDNIYNQSIEEPEYDEDGNITSIYYGSIYYKAYVLLVKMNTSRLMIDMAEYLEANN